VIEIETHLEEEIDQSAWMQRTPLQENPIQKMMREIPLPLPVLFPFRIPKMGPDLLNPLLTSMFPGSDGQPIIPNGAGMDVVTKTFTIPGGEMRMTIISGTSMSPFLNG
jgi:hypothetical protein